MLIIALFKVGILIAKMYRRKMLRNAVTGNVRLRVRNQVQSKLNCQEREKQDYILAIVIRIKRDWSKFSWIIKKLQLPRK